MISNAIYKDIYIISKSSGDIFIDLDTNYNLYYKNRISIVLFHDHIKKHYTTVGLVEENRIKTYFDPHHPFICFLRERLISKLKL